MCLHQRRLLMQQQNEHPPSHCPPQERQHTENSKYFVNEDRT
jgi:hypothetical protein